MSTLTIDWDETISMLRSPFIKLSPDGRKRLNKLAGDWRTCAVGEMLEMWYDEKDVQIMDDIVWELAPEVHGWGVTFTRLIRQSRWAQAERYVLSIRGKLTAKLRYDIIKTFEARCAFLKAAKETKFTEVR